MLFRFQLRLTLLPLLLIFLPGSLCYAENDIMQEESEPTFVDQTHQEISESLVGLTRWFDKFFQDPRFDEEPAGTSVRLRGSVISEEGEKLSFKGRAKAHLKLPNLKRRFHLVLSSEEDDLRDETLKDARINRKLTERDKNNLALQYTQERSALFSLTHRVGLDFNDGPTPRVRSRVRYSIPIADESLLTLTQAVFWKSSEGFGEESRIDYDFPLSEKKLIRTTGLGLFSEESNGYEWLGMLQWLQSFSHKRALAIGGFVAGETRPDNDVTEYDIFFKYRQRFLKKWLFVEFKPEVNWARDNNFESSGIFTLTLEAQFYN